MKNLESTLPPGFRFHPTDEELILHYLRKKMTSPLFTVSIIADVDIYKFDPWELPAKAAFGEKEWYFFSPRDRKYPNGARPNRAAGSGYWKATGTDKAIVASTQAAGGGGQDNINIGVKKALVFYKGRPPKGIKTNWIMHEYRLSDASNYYNCNRNIKIVNNKPMKLKDSSMRLDDWVLCRIYRKSNALAPTTSPVTVSDQEQEKEEEDFSGQDFVFPSLKTLPNQRTLNSQRSCSFSNLLDATDYSLLRSFLSDGHNDSTGFEFSTSGSVDQPFLNNSTINNSNNFLQKMPQNRLKREHSNSNIHEDILYPSKKVMASSCNITNSTNQLSDINSQINFLNQPFLNQKLFLSGTHYYQPQFQG